MRRRTKVSRRFLNTSTSAEPGSNNISHCQTYTRVTYVGKFQNPDRRQSSYFKNDNSVSVIDKFKKKKVNVYRYGRFDFREDILV